jgi:hypothetical protein
MPKVRKERDPNWNRLEMVALVRAKRAEFMDELEADDPRELMNPEMSKWHKISVAVNAVQGISCYRSPEACKYKWQTLLPEYKRVADVHKDTGVNSTLYFEMSFRERKEKALPKNFDQYVYRDMHEWLKHKPTMTPPHFRDLLSPTDGNYTLPTILEYGTGDFLNHSGLKERSLPTSPLQAYSSAAAYDAAAEVLEDSEDVPGETEVLVAGNQTVPVVRSPPPTTYSTANFGGRPTGNPAVPPWTELPSMDLNATMPTSPVPGRSFPPPQPYTSSKSHFIAASYIPPAGSCSDSCQPRWNYSASRCAGPACNVQQLHRAACNRH